VSISTSRSIAYRTGIGHNYTTDVQNRQRPRKKITTSHENPIEMAQYTS